MGLDISRIHLHPYGSFFVCYDTSKWDDGRSSIMKSSMAIPPYCLDPTKSGNHLNDNLQEFSVDNLPEYFDHPHMPEERITVNRTSLIYDFDLMDDIHCYMQYFIKCKNVYKTAGMGDTVSSTGFIYHDPIFSDREQAKKEEEKTKAN